MAERAAPDLIRRGYVFELDPNREQTAKLAQAVGTRRFVYNWGLAESQRAYEATGKRPSLTELRSELVALKGSDATWLRDVSSHVPQQALFDLERGFSRFFRSVKGQGQPSGFPRFKRKGERDSARFYGATLSDRHVFLPKIGRVRLKQSKSSRRFQGKILSATLRKRADRWFVSLCVECTRPRSTNSSGAVGVDLGLKSAAVLHDGSSTQIFEPRQALRRRLRRLRHYDRQLARKERGSCNYEKARLRRARLYYRVSCQRQDYLHQLSSRLAKTKSVIVLEDLNVRGMKRNRHLALSVVDAGMSELRRQIAYKSAWYGAAVVIADRFYPSSKTCSGCGTIKQSLSLSERKYVCEVCGIVIDRDENAAINLYRLADETKLPVDRREVTPVKREALVTATVTNPSSLKQEASDSRSIGSTRRDERKGSSATPYDMDEASNPQKTVPNSDSRPSSDPGARGLSFRPLGPEGSSF